jgi:SAM-dependent methyltransferase
MRLLFRRKRQRATPPPPTSRKYRAVTIAGRRHLADVPYALPKDLNEVNRLDFQHYIYRQVLHGNFLVPIRSPQAILDVGCGTGIWCREIATQFPQARVYGLDLENIKDSVPLPPNYQFVQGDILEGLAFAANTFDFVHQRLILASAIPVARWLDVCRELLRVARPGGWLELPEVGVQMHNMGPLTQQFFAWGISASEPRGLDPRQIPHLDSVLREAGGRNVGLWWVDVPMYKQGNRIGLMMQMNLTNAFGALKGLYAARGESEAEFDNLLRKLPFEWETYRSSLRFFVFSCQK